jgi:hypothetical protein
VPGSRIGDRAESGYSAHSMRVKFITTAQENGAALDDVQRAAGLCPRVALALQPLNGLAFRLRFTTQAAGNPGTQHHMANRLTTNA